MASKVEYQDLEVKGTVKANEFAGGILKNSGFEVVTSLPTIDLFEGREVMYNGKKYVYSSGWKEEITANTMYEANLLWGGRNIVNGFSPIDAAMVDSLSANLMAFPNPAGITVEYSRDAGVTWIDYGASDKQKIEVFTIARYYYFTCGNPALDSSPMNVNFRLRVTLDTKVCGFYSQVNKVIAKVTTRGSNRCWLTILAKKNRYSDSDAFYETIVDKARIKGWPGYNVLNFSPFITHNVGPGAGEYDKIRFVFGYDSITEGYNGIGLTLSSLSLYGNGRYKVPSNLARNNHLYSYDYQQNALFPAKVESQEVINFDVNNIEPTQTGTVSKTSTWLWQYLTQGINWLRAKLANGSISLNSTTVKLGDTAILPWYVDYNDVNYPARLRDNWLQIYRNGVWGNLMYLTGQEAIQPTQVVQITSLDNLDWYNEQVSEYEVDDNTTQSILAGTILPAAALMNCPAEQLTLNFYPISGKKYGKGALDSLISDLQGKGFSVYVENDLDAILSSGSDYLVRLKISKVPTPKAIIECYVAR